MTATKESVHAEFFEGGMQIGEWQEIKPITYRYLQSIGMSDQEIIDLHRAVWDIALWGYKPRDRTKTPRNEARAIKNELESRYGIDDYSKPLEGQPEPVSYETGIEQILGIILEPKEMVITGGMAVGKTSLARRVARLARKRGQTIEVYDDFPSFTKTKSHTTINTALYCEEHENIRPRVHIEVPRWRQIWNAAKCLPTFHARPGLLTRHLLQRYEVDFQKSVSDILINYSAGRFLLPDSLTRIKRYEEDYG
ncbi:hypothetical protein KY310_02675 [Candidatus Woesearchaeota archaeon]|nr:hypothetical protein [Candidatus Woesearchaeota archaeon]